MLSIIKLFRVHQYVKNFFIFIPLFFAGKFFNIELVQKTVITFFSFSMIASSIYILNDIFDIEEDRKHPEKKDRPLASGAISIRTAIILALIMVLSGTTIAYLLSKTLLLLFLIYIIMNILYTIKLKHIAIIDIFIIAIGFILRLFYCSAVTNIYLSHWIIIMTFLLALFLGLAKRRDDRLIFNETEQTTRKVIHGYTLEFLNIAMSMMATIVIVAYIMYTASAEVIKHTGTDKIYITTIWVIFGILRYLQITLVENKSGSPTKILLKDRVIQFCILAWLTTFGVFLY